MAPDSDGARRQDPRSGSPSGRRESPGSFEDKLRKFMKQSQERLADLKHNIESKGGGYRHR